MGSTINMGNTRAVVCKVSLTLMRKLISKYHSALVLSLRSLGPKSTKYNISNKDINNSELTPLLHNMNTINLEFPIIYYIHD